MKLPLLKLGTFILLACGVCSAQWSTEQPVDTRVEPIYPRSPYSFRTTSSNYNPYQFNWATGQWIYVPIPYAPEAAGSSYNPYRFNAYTGRWDYLPIPAQPGVGPVNRSALAAPPPPPPPDYGQPPPPPAAPPPMDDTSLWTPTTLPSVQIAKPIVMTFEGKVISERAVDLYGDGRPHLLVRLRRADGASGTVDVGERLDLPESELKSGGSPTITATGNLGEIDGTPVLFANQVKMGNVTTRISRGAATQASQ
jgi:hypothetical protein